MGHVWQKKNMDYIMQRDLFAPSANRKSIELDQKKQRSKIEGRNQLFITPEFYRSGYEE